MTEIFRARTVAEVEEECDRFIEDHFLNRVDYTKSSWCEGFYFYIELVITKQWSWVVYFELSFKKIGGLIWKMKL